MVSNDIIIDIEDSKEDIEIKIESKQYSNLQTKTVSPTTEIQTITYDSGYDALKEVIVNAVDSNIDPNIASENIKSGVEILGVEGSYAPEYEGSYQITQNGTYETSGKKMNQDLVVTVDDALEKLLTNTLTSYKMPDGVTSVKNYLFYNNSNLVSIDFNDATSIGQYAFQSTGLSGELDLSKMVSIGQYAFQTTARSINKLRVGNVNTPTTIGQYAFQAIGGNYSNAEVYAPNLTYGSGQNIFVSSSIKKATIGGFLPAYIFQYVRGMTTLILENNFTNNNFCSSSPFYGWQSYLAYGLRNVYFKGKLNDWMSIKAFNDHVGMCTQDIYFKDDNGDTIVDDVKYSKVTSISIPRDITELKQYQFQCFRSLINVSIYDNITSLPAYIFNDCQNMNGLYLFSNQVISLSSTSGIPSVNNNLIVYVPQSLVSSYQSATNWSTLVNNGTIRFMGMAE